jgi:exosortase A-associated hydrolase 2
MNKSRRMVALQAAQLAADGWVVMQVDLLGTGDSSGDFADASWDAWLADVQLAVGWMRQQGVDQIWLWGLRLGGLLAAEAVRRFDLTCGLLLWQPVISGKQHLQQFLRLWKMAQVVGKVLDQGRSPQQLLDAGELAEVAGYTVSPALADGMRNASIGAAPTVTSVHWVQIGAAAAPLPNAAVQLQDTWRAQGMPVSFAAVEGVQFWQTQEIAELPELLACTRAMLLTAMTAAGTPA